MKTGKIVVLSFLGIILLIALTFGLGYLGVFHTKTVGKAQHNADREVFEQTQSYVEGKRQEAMKMYKEWVQAETPTEKKALENLVAHTFANIDEQKYFTNPVKTWVYNCKYGVVQSESPPTPFK